MSEGIFTLKDGSEVLDPRMDRIEQFDERSRGFSVIDILKLRQKKRPRSYTWRCRKHLNQGREGACAGFTLAHELIARPVELMDINHEDARRFYHAAQKIDPWPGGEYEGAYPRYSGTSILAAVKTGKKLGYYDSYHWSFGLKDLIMGVGYKGPAIMGITVYQGMVHPDRRGFIKPTGRKLGGHAILCKGVNVRKKYFTLHNSWGTRYGRNGDCFITFDDMEKLLKQNGEAVFVTGRKRK